MMVDGEPYTPRGVCTVREGVGLRTCLPHDQGNLRPRLAQELTRLPQGNDQTRVLALIRRYQLTKDQTARLIDWWHQASDSERCQLEQKGGFPLPQRMHAMMLAFSFYPSQFKILV